MSKIRVTSYENSSCVKCDKVEKNMILIGAVSMCHHCHELEFGGQLEIPVDSKLYKNTYLPWVRTYTNKSK